MADEPFVTGISLISHRPLPEGGTQVAFFDCKVAGMKLFGCGLLFTRKGEFNVIAPRMEEVRGHRRSVEFHDKVLRASVTAKALAAFDALGGVRPVTESRDPTPVS